MFKMSKQSISLSYRFCWSQKVCVCQEQLVYVLDSLFLSQTAFVSPRQFVSVTYSMCLWQIVGDLHTQSSQTLCVCHRLSVSETDRLCLSQSVCVCHRKGVSVTYSLSLYQTLFLKLLACFFSCYTCFSSRFVGNI